MSAASSRNLWPMKYEEPRARKSATIFAKFAQDANFKDVSQRRGGTVDASRFTEESIKMALHGKLFSDLDIVQLIYCSHAAKAENKSEFERDLFDILDRSHAYNSLHDITGALMTDGGMFAHVVEGPAAAVRNLYAEIMRDERHNRVLTLQHTLVHVRLFGLWPVVLLRVGAMPHARTLDAQSTPVELRKVSVCLLKAFRPLLLK